MSELEKLLYLGDLIESQKLQCQNLETLLYGISALDYSKEKFQASSKNVDDKIVNLIAKITTLKNDLITNIDDFIDLQKIATQKINKMDNPKFKALLTYRYLDKLTWEDIAEKMELSYQWVWVLHKKSLKNYYAN